MAAPLLALQEVDSASVTTCVSLIANLSRKHEFEHQLAYRVDRTNRKPLPGKFRADVLLVVIVTALPDASAAKSTEVIAPIAVGD